MRFVFAAFALFTLIFSMSAGSVYAQGVLDPACADTPDATLCQENDNTSNDTAGSNSLLGPDGTITRGVGLLQVLAGVIAVVMVTISGVQMAISSGDAQKIAKARQTIIYTVVGLILTLLATQIVVFVLSNLN